MYLQVGNDQVKTALAEKNFGVFFHFENAKKVIFGTFKDEPLSVEPTLSLHLVGT